MSYSLDVNIFLYASDESCPHHAKARAFLESCAKGTRVLCLSWATIMAYLRIATHPAIFDTPLSPQEACGNMEQFLSLPHVRLVTEEDGFWEIYQETTEGLTVRGTMVPDCHLAALLKQHEIRTLFTCDSDFRRFTFIDVRNPLADV